MKILSEVEWNINSANLLQTYKAQTFLTLNTYSQLADRFDMFLCSLDIEMW